MRALRHTGDCISDRTRRLLGAVVGGLFCETAAERVDDELQQTTPSLAGRRVEPGRVQVFAEHRQYCASKLVEVARLHRRTPRALREREPLTATEWREFSIQETSHLKQNRNLHCQARHCQMYYN